MLIAWKSHLHIRPANLDGGKRRGTIADHGRCQQAVMHLAGDASVMIGAAYLYSGEGLTPRNLTTLSALGLIMASTSMH